MRASKLRMKGVLAVFDASSRDASSKSDGGVGWTRQPCPSWARSPVSKRAQGRPSKRHNAIQFNTVEDTELCKVLFTVLTRCYHRVTPYLWYRVVTHALQNKDSESHISTDFAACFASCILHAAKPRLISEWMPQWYTVFCTDHSRRSRS